MLTIPNAISLIRLIGAPLIIWFGMKDENLWVIGLLIIASASDYLDGKLARALNQRSKIGEVLDPTTDRIYIFAILYLLWAKGIIPFWLVLALIIRDLIMLIINGILKYRRLPLMKVSFMGKAATFNLLYALPLLFVAKIDGQVGEIAWIAGWAFAFWGMTLYFLTGFRYLLSALKTIRFQPMSSRVNER